MRLLSISPVIVGLLCSMPAHAKEPPVQSGQWGELVAGEPACAKPFLTLNIPRSLIVEHLDEGNGRCRISGLKRGRNGLYVGEKSCEWDASVPQGLRENPDEDDEGRFSLRVISKSEIEYRNMRFGYCGARS